MIKGIARVSETGSKYEQGAKWARTIGSKSYESTHGVLPNSLVPFIPRSLFPEKNQKNILHTSIANDS